MACGRPETRHFLKVPHAPESSNISETNWGVVYTMMLLHVEHVGVMLGMAGCIHGNHYIEPYPPPRRHHCSRQAMIEALSHMPKGSKYPVSEVSGSKNHTVDARKLEYDCPPTPKPRKEGKQKHPRPRFQLFGVYCTLWLSEPELLKSLGWDPLGWAQTPAPQVPWLGIECFGLAGELKAESPAGNWDFLRWRIDT